MLFDKMRSMREIRPRKRFWILNFSEIHLLCHIVPYTTHLGDMFTSDHRPRCVFVIRLFLSNHFHSRCTLDCSRSSVQNPNKCCILAHVLYPLSWYVHIYDLDFSPISWQWYLPWNIKCGYHQTRKIGLQGSVEVATLFATYNIEQTIVFLLCINMTDHTIRVK